MSAVVEQDQGFEFDAGAVANIDQSTVEQSGPTYPVIQWHYGDAKAKRAGGMAYGGGWFIKADMADEATLVANGWVKEEWTHDSGASEEGFYKPAIAVSVIAIRKRWEVAGDGPRQVGLGGQRGRQVDAGQVASVAPRRSDVVQHLGVDVPDRHGPSLGCEKGTQRRSPRACSQHGAAHEHLR